LFPKDKGPIIAALLTAVGGLLTWMITAGVELDGRIDRLEQATRILLGPDGQIIPAPESVEARFHAAALEREITALRERIGHLEGRLLQGK